MILVAGVSKSGKTTTCIEAVRRLPGLRHVKASTILRSIGRPTTDLSNAEIMANQTALVRALDDEWRRDKIDLLDGHAVVETGSVAIRLPPKVFDSLRLSGIAVALEEPHVISRRRSGTAFETSVDRIAHFQRMEVECCSIEASRLLIPFVVLQGDRVRDLCLFWKGINAQRAASR